MAQGSQCSCHDPFVARLDLQVSDPVQHFAHLRFGELEEILVLHRNANQHRVNELLKGQHRPVGGRSEEHTSELQSLMRISYAVFCLKKNRQKQYTNTRRISTKNTIH